MDWVRRFAGRVSRRMTPDTAWGSGIAEPPSDLDAARRRWEPAADAGDSDAMYNLGYLYAFWTEPPDLDAAQRWWERAVDGGDIDAIYKLGYLYEQLMDPPDLDAARRWYERAADAG